MTESRPGRYVTTSVAGENVDAYVPAPLPPEPPLVLEPLYAALERADRALGRLDGATSLLPDTALFLYMYVRKEALLSSQIEGTQSSLSDLILFEHDAVPGAPIDDVQEVSTYVAAMELGAQRIRDGMPVAVRLIKELHGVLLATGRGSKREPGQFRRSQNWLGGSRPGNARFVPPPAQEVLGCMSALEKFINASSPSLPLLVRVALVHVQFETIHPFLDGNGRLGRLVVTLMLLSEKALSEPMLYLSLFLKSHRDEYYELLQGVRQNGNWGAWLEFFLRGVEQTSNQAAATARALVTLLANDRALIEGLGRAAGSALRVHQLLQTSPVIAVATVAEALSLSKPTIGKSIDHLVHLGVLEEITGRQRDRLFVYRRYMDVLSEGTEPLTVSR